MAITLNGTTGISSPGGDTSTSLATTNLSYTGTLTGGTGVIAIGTNQIYKDASGNVGIGATPSYRLDVSSAGSAATETSLRLTNPYTSGTSVAATNILFGYHSGAANRQSAKIEAGQQTPGTFVAGYLAFSTQTSDAVLTEAARIDSSGNLLVGSTSAISGFNNQISSTGSSTNRGAVIIGRTTAATSGVCGSIIAFNGSNAVCGFDLQSNGANNSGFIQSYTYNAGAYAQGPYVNTGGTSWTTASDERLKDISGVIEGALEKTSSLRAIEYTLKSDPSKIERVGLVAQEVQKVLPQAVSEDSEGYLGVQYTDTIPLLVAAIKELTTRLEALEAQ